MVLAEAAGTIVPETILRIVALLATVNFLMWKLWSILAQDVSGLNRIAMRAILTAPRRMIDVGIRYAGPTMDMEGRHGP